MTKQYKPGQLITINKKVYRITKRVDYTKNVCDKCSLRFDVGNRNSVCWMLCIPRLPNNCYLKLVRICGKRDS